MLERRCDGARIAVGTHADGVIPLTHTGCRLLELEHQCRSFRAAIGHGLQADQRRERRAAPCRGPWHVHLPHDNTDVPYELGFRVHEIRCRPGKPPHQAARADQAWRGHAHAPPAFHASGVPGRPGLAMQMREDVLITCDDLAAALDEATVLDASWIYGPFNHAAIDVRSSYAAAHVPGSWFLDLASFSDPSDGHDPRVEVIAPPPPDALRTALARAGAGPDSLVVVTDMDGSCTTAPFARHALMRAGFADVRLLDGGTPAWRRGPVGSTANEPRYLHAGAAPAPFAPDADPDLPFASHVWLKRVLEGRELAQIVDTRVDRSNQGVLPPDYAGLEVPASAHVPSNAVLEPADEALRFRREPELRAIFETAGIDRRIVKLTTCYFGLGASVVATALEIARLDPVLVYPGSLVEYAVRERLVQPP